MLDANNYPKAYLVLGNKKMELSDISLQNKSVKGSFLLKKKK